MQFTNAEYKQCQSKVRHHHFQQKLANCMYSRWHSLHGSHKENKVLECSTVVKFSCGTFKRVGEKQAIQLALSDKYNRFIIE